VRGNVPEAGKIINVPFRSKAVRRLGGARPPIPRDTGATPIVTRTQSASWYEDC